MGNFFVNGYDLYHEVKKDPEAFIWKIVSAASVVGEDITEDVKDAVSEIVIADTYEDVAEVCDRLLEIIGRTIGVEPHIEKERGK
jgi:hypothetical protein